MTVTVASGLLYMIAVLELGSVALTAYIIHLFFGVIDADTTDFSDSGRPGTGLATTVVVIVVVIGAIFSIGYAILGFFDYRGSNAARIVTWVIGGVTLCCSGGSVGNTSFVHTDTGASSSTTTFDTDLTNAIPGWTLVTARVLGAVVLLSIIAVIILLVMPASNAYFKPRVEGLLGYQYGQPGQPAPGLPPYPGQSYPGYPGAGYPSAGYPGAGSPGAGSPGAGYPGAAQGQPGYPAYPAAPGDPSAYPGNAPGSSPAYPGYPAASPGGAPGYPYQDPYAQPPLPPAPGTQPPLPPAPGTQPPAPGTQPPEQHPGA